MSGYGTVSVESVLDNVGAVLRLLISYSEEKKKKVSVASRLELFAEKFLLWGMGLVAIPSAVMLSFKWIHGNVSAFWQLVFLFLMLLGTVSYLTSFVLIILHIRNEVKNPFGASLQPVVDEARRARESTLLSKLCSFSIPVLELAIARLQLEFDQLGERLKISMYVVTYGVLPTLCGSIAFVWSPIKADPALIGNADKFMPWMQPMVDWIWGQRLWMLWIAASLFVGLLFGALMLARAIRRSSYYVGLLNLAIQLKKSYL